jgi:glutamate 5-kinase
VLLSDVEGLCNGNPRESGVKVINTVERLDKSVFDLVCDKSGGRGKGGMASKLEAARLCTSAGENVIIASGRDADVLPKILAGDVVGTLFLAQGQSLAARKRWIGSVKPRGLLRLDKGAEDAVLRKGRSLLAAGVVELDGHFAKGDVVALRGPDGTEIARGLTNYGHEELLQIKGLRTGQIAGVLGDCPYEEVIHRDNMVVTALGE